MISVAQKVFGLSCRNCRFRRFSYLCAVFLWYVYAFRRRITEEMLYFQLFTEVFPHPITPVGLSRAVPDLRDLIRNFPVTISALLRGTSNSLHISEMLYLSLKRSITLYFRLTSFQLRTENFAAVRFPYAVLQAHYSALFFSSEYFFCEHFHFCVFPGHDKTSCCSYLYSTTGGSFCHCLFFGVGARYLLRFSEGNGVKT